MNLNKFTKAELISKLRLRDLQDHKNKINEVIIKTSIFERIKTWTNKIWDFIVKFINFLMKITIIRLAFKSFKNYSWIKRFWKIINGLILGIFGFSILDNFGIDFINNLFIEVKILLYNITNYLTNSQFYNWLDNFWSKKDKSPSSSPREMNQIKSEIKTETHWNDKNIGSSDRNSSKVSSWFEPPKTELTEAESNSYIKYYIIASVLFIGGCFVYYYWNDIMANTNSWYDTIRGYIRGDDPDDNLPPNRRAEVERVIMEKDGISPVYPPKDIPEIRVSSPPLTSPSFDDLTSKANESWATDSSSSTETIKPIASSSKSSIDNYKIISESLKDNPFNKDSGLFSDKLNDIKFWGENWRKLLDKEILENINLIEKINQIPKDEIDRNADIVRLDLYANIVANYNKQVNNFDYKLSINN